MENINTERLSEEYIDATLGLAHLDDEEELENDGEEAEAEPLLHGLSRSINYTHILQSSITVKTATKKGYMS